jgi:uncharacterized membrane protein YcaP (DUF421 family)
MDLLTGLFGTKGDVSWLQECARAALIFAYGYAAVRLVGRRVFGKWAALDIIISLVIGSNLSRALTGNAPLWGTLAATTLLLGIHWLLAQLAARSSRLSHLIEGHPVRLARDGRPDLANLRRWSISEADVNEALRQRGLARLEDSQDLVLEPSGRVNVLGKS